MAKRVVQEAETLLADVRGALETHLHETNQHAREALRKRRVGAFERDDIVQQVLMATMRHYATVHGPGVRVVPASGELRNYAARASVRRLINSQRGEQRRRRYEGECARVSELHAPSPEESFLRREIAGI
jgi:RNA polymerase sigma factor (sigma-70 family)